MTTHTKFEADANEEFTYQKFNGMSHLVMFPIAFFLTIVLAITADRQESLLKVFSVAIYGFTMTCVFLASGLYHITPAGPKLRKILRRIDQGSIFPYIAATSTVVSLIPLYHSNGILLTALIWLLSIGGVYLKATDKDLPFALEVMVYILLGCLCLVDVDVLISQLPKGAFHLLALGGALYILGAIIVALEDVFDRDGTKNFHEIWHILVILGTVCHWIVIQFYIVYL